MTGRAEFVRLVRGQAGFLELTEEQVGALWGHFELLSRWNRRLNLTRVVAMEEAAKVHYLESLFVAAWIPGWVKKVADAGSGAGFPGFVVAVARPELAVTLVEADQRKAAFLREAGDMAGNVKVLARRSEEVEERFDAVISRAVRAADVLKFAERAARWAGLVISKRDAEDWAGQGGRGIELPGGRGVFWVSELPRRAGKR